MKKSDFYYDLPDELIAQTPVEPRDHSRLMQIDRNTGEIQHKHFYDLLEILQPGDLLVMNDSRVLPARLYGENSTSFPICLKAALISSHNFFNVSPPNSLIKSVALSTVGSSFSISLLPHILQNFALASALIPHFGHIFTIIFPSFFCSIYSHWDLISDFKL